MPNLFSFMPVEILAWVRASMSGLTRIATGAIWPRAVAISLSRRSSGTDFDIDLVDLGVERGLELARVLPTPEKTIRCGGTPAARARRNSPSETTSAPAPRPAKRRRTARFELALTA